jgi:YVTN family beta-propeller protein
MAERSEELYVANMRGGTISVVDLDSYQVIDTIEMEEIEIEGESWRMQVDSLWCAPDKRTMYASRYPGPVGRSRGEARRPGDLIAIDTRTRQIKWTVPVSGQANHIIGAPDGSRVYVPIRDRHYVEAIDTERQEVVARMDCGWGPHGSEISEDGRHLYLGTMWQHQVSVVDTTDGSRVKSIPMGDSVRPFCITKDQRTMYVQLSRLHGFKVVDLERDAISQTVHLPTLPAGIELEDRFAYTVNHGLRMLPDETRLFAAASVADYVAVYSLPDLRLLDTIPSGGDPAYIGLSEGADRIFVCNRRDDTVSLFSVETHEELARIDVGIYPNRMASVTPAR